MTYFNNSTVTLGRLIRAALVFLCTALAAPAHPCARSIRASCPAAAPAHPSARPHLLIPALAAPGLQAQRSIRASDGQEPECSEAHGRTRAACPAPTHPRATPYRPPSDAVVLATVPAGTRTAITSPRNLQNALAQAAADIELARASGDPRYLGYAQSALGPWWSAKDAPLPALLIRAQIHQHNHSFAPALRDLDHALVLDPRNAQARLTRAAIHQVQGKYTEAAADCRSLALIVEPLVTADCISRVSSHRGDAHGAYRKLLAMRDRANEMEPRQRREIELTLADISMRLGDAVTARQHYEQAIAATDVDAYTLLAFADFLLDQHEYRQVVTLFEHHAEYADLLLRAALAARAAGAANAGYLAQRLREQYAAHQRRGDFVPSRDYAKFLLDIEGKASAALNAALTNWQSQREPSDAIIVVRAAIAAGRPTAAAPVVTFVRQHGLEDVRLARLLNQVLPERP
jgi:Tfp pilus assembly protein PilF